MRVLIADDDPVSLRVLEARLLKWKYEVIVARDGDEALAVLQGTDAPMLAILDWVMPGMDGVEVCRRVRQLPTATASYFILLTSKSETADVIAGLEAGADDYLTKPFAGGELRARIDVGARVIGLQKKLADRVEELNQVLVERDRADESMRASESRYRHLVEHSQGLICTHDFDGKLLSVNPAAARLLGYQPDEMLGRNLREFIPPSQAHQFDIYLERIIKHETDGGILNILTKSGELRVWQYHNSRYEEPGKESYVVGHAQDVTELKQVEAQLRNLSLTDELTGLNNRRAFYALAEQHLKTARRDGRPFAIVYADMDGLKYINDTFGHPAGSHAIQMVASILKNSFRAADIIARLGGDEFAILVSNISAEAVKTPLGHLQDNLRRYNEQRLHDYDLSMSLGAVWAGADNDSPLEDLLSTADQAMYENKQRKRQVSSERGDSDLIHTGLRPSDPAPRQL
jgi:diguanylate cyclase (GGDEF)-like protein/PAS domain S-box-containing protein